MYKFIHGLVVSCACLYYEAIWQWLCVNAYIESIVCFCFIVFCYVTNIWVGAADIVYLSVIGVVLLCTTQLTAIQ